MATTIADQYEILFPDAVFALTKWFDWVNLSLFSLIQIGCKVGGRAGALQGAGGVLKVAAV